MPYVRPAPSVSSLPGEISDTQHGPRTGPNDAHEFADITGLAAHAARHNAGGLDAVAAPAHAATTGQTADQHHKRTEAKETPGGGLESVTWTTAFATVPAVNVSQVGSPDTDISITARSTTGATGSTNFARVKMFIAQELT